MWYWQNKKQTGSGTDERAQNRPLKHKQLIVDRIAKTIKLRKSLQQMVLEQLDIHMQKI